MLGTIAMGDEGAQNHKSTISPARQCSLSIHLDDRNSSNMVLLLSHYKLCAYVKGDL